LGLELFIGFFIKGGYLRELAHILELVGEGDDFGLVLGGFAFQLADVQEGSFHFGILALDGCDF
jgi:hypothetical protein